MEILSLKHFSHPSRSCPPATVPSNEDWEEATITVLTRLQRSVSTLGTVSSSSPGAAPLLTSDSESVYTNTHHPRQVGRDRVRPTLTWVPGNTQQKQLRAVAEQLHLVQQNVRRDAILCPQPRPATSARRRAAGEKRRGRQGMKEKPSWHGFRIPAQNSLPQFCRVPPQRTPVLGFRNYPGRVSAIRHHLSPDHWSPGKVSTSAES